MYFFSGPGIINTLILNWQFIFFKYRSDKKRKKKRRRKSRSKSRTPNYEAKNNEHDDDPQSGIINANSDELQKREEDAKLIFQFKTKRCTTNKNVFGADLSLTEESFASDEDNTNKITISRYKICIRRS